MKRSVLTLMEPKFLAVAVPAARAATNRHARKNFYDYAVNFGTLSRYSPCRTIVLYKPKGIDQVNRESSNF